MPLLKQNLVVWVTSKVKVLLSVRAAVTRGEIPSIDDIEEQLNLQTQELVKSRRRTAELQKRLDGQQGALSPASSTDSGTQLYFVVGNGRSGTTWLQSILDSHPEVMCRGEGWFFNRNYRQDAFKNRRERIPVGSLYNAILNSEYINLWIDNSVWTVGDKKQEHLDNLTQLAVNYFLTKRIEGTGKRIVGDKTASPGIEALEDISKICPEAKVINIVRDGRDVAVSVMHFLWNHSKSEGGIYELAPEELEIRKAYRKDPDAFAGKSIFTEKRLKEIVKGWKSEVAQAAERGPSLLGDNYLEVRYEDLLGDSQNAVSRVLAFLGADTSENVVNECIEATGFERLSKRKQGQEQSSSVRFRKGVAGDWRNVFTERDRRIFKEHAGDLLIRLGYEKDKDW